MLHGGRTMPEFTTISVTEAQIRTIPGRQGRFINEYADYTQQVPQGHAGKLRIGEDEKHATVRRRLVSAAQALGRNLIIKRSGSDIYLESGAGSGATQTRASETWKSRRQLSSTAVWSAGGSQTSR